MTGCLTGVAAVHSPGPARLGAWLALTSVAWRRAAVATGQLLPTALTTRDRANVAGLVLHVHMAA